MMEPVADPTQDSFMKINDSPPRQQAGNHQQPKDFMDGFSARMEYQSHDNKTRMRKKDVDAVSSMMMKQQSAKVMDVYDGQPAGTILDSMRGDHLHAKAVLR